MEAASLIRPRIFASRPPWRARVLHGQDKACSRFYVADAGRPQSETRMNGGLNHLDSDSHGRQEFAARGPKAEDLAGVEPDLPDSIWDIHFNDLADEKSAGARRELRRSGQRLLGIARE